MIAAGNRGFGFVAGRFLGGGFSGKFRDARGLDSFYVVCVVF